jgi:hypothetical protein
MNPTTLKEAIQAAKVFIKAAKEIEVKTLEAYSGKKILQHCNWEKNSNSKAQVDGFN